MINKLKIFRKNYLTKMKSFHDYWVEHSMQRKLIFVGVIAGMMALLVIGTKLVPEKSKFADSPMNSALSFGQNGSATVKMTGRKYNEDKQYMVINFTVAPDNGAAIDPDNISFKAVTINSANVKYQVLPLADNHFVVMLTGLEKGYKAVQITATNKQPDISMLEEKANSLSDSSAISSSSENNTTQAKDSVDFVINEDTRFINNKIPKLSRKQYAVQSLKDSVKTSNKQITSQQKLITAYQKQIEADNSAIKSTEQDAKYKVDKTDPENTIQDAQSDITSQQTKIDDAGIKIKSIRAQKKLYNKQITAINNGTYKFRSPVKADKMNG